MLSVNLALPKVDPDAWLKERARALCAALGLEPEETIIETIAAEFDCMWVNGYETGANEE